MFQEIITLILCVTCGAFVGWIGGYFIGKLINKIERMRKDD